MALSFLIGPTDTAEHCNCVASGQPCEKYCLCQCDGTSSKRCVEVTHNAGDEISLFKLFLPYSDIYTCLSWTTGTLGASARPHVTLRNARALPLAGNATPICAWGRSGSSCDWPPENVLLTVDPYPYGFPRCGASRFKLKPTIYRPGVSGSPVTSECQIADAMTQSSCKNVPIQRRHHKKIKISPSEIAGWGVFLLEPVQKGESKVMNLFTVHHAH